MVQGYMEITKDRVVSIDYTLTDSNEQFIDSSSGSGPLSYLHGHENIISGLERALEGKKEGDHVSVSVSAADAYGERDERLVINVSLDRFQDADVIEEGMQFEAETPEGESRIVTVTKVAAGHATVDANHPLAGMDLHFELDVMTVRAASAEELEHGHPHIHGCGTGDGCGDGCSCGADCGHDEAGCGSDCGCGNH